MDLAIADLDEDGLADVAVANTETPTTRARFLIDVHMVSRHSSYSGGTPKGELNTGAGNACATCGHSVVLPDGGDTAASCRFQRKWLG